MIGSKTILCFTSETRKNKMVHKFKIGDKVKLKEGSEFSVWFENGTRNLEIADFIGSSYFVWENDKSKTWAVPEEELEKETWAVRMRKLGGEIQLQNKIVLELSNGELLMFDTQAEANEYLYNNPQNSRMYNAKPFRDVIPTVRFQNLK